MKSKFGWMLFVVLLLGLLVACGGGAEEAAPTATAVPPTAEATAVPPTLEPTAVPETAPEATDVPATAVPEAETSTDANAAAPAEGESVAIADILTQIGQDSPTALQSYQYQLVMRLTNTLSDGQEQVQSITMVNAFSTEPPAASMSITMEGVDEAQGFGQMTMVELDGMSYMVLPEMGCVTSDASQGGLFGDNPFQDTMSPNALLEDMDVSQARRVLPDEEINGIDTIHYTFDESLMNASGDNTQQIEDAEGHLYIAKDGGYLVKMVMDASGSGLNFLDDTTDSVSTAVHFEYTLISANETVEITIPAECEGQAAAMDVPMLEDATEVSSFAGFVSYKSALTLEEAVTFYEESLIADGWVKNEDESFSFEGLSGLVYTRENEKLSITISTEDTGGISVLIIQETPE